MKKISSFTVDHDKLSPGIYISRIDGDITTFDIRFKRPNAGDYLSTAAAHTLEHLLATFLRSSALADSVIYFGPMGCRTGFYLLLRDVKAEPAVELIKSAVAFAAEYKDELPGNKREECGNYLDHNPEEARREAAEFKITAENWNSKMIHYTQ